MIASAQPLLTTRQSPNHFIGKHVHKIPYRVVEASPKVLLQSRNHVKRPQRIRKGKNRKNHLEIKRRNSFISEFTVVKLASPVIGTRILTFRFCTSLIAMVQFPFFLADREAGTLGGETPESGRADGRVGNGNEDLNGLSFTKECALEKRQEFQPSSFFSLLTHQFFCRV